MTNKSTTLNIRQIISFNVPIDARWNIIASYATFPKKGKVIDKAMEVIEKENPVLKGVLSKNYSRPELDKTRLGELLPFLPT